MFIASFILYYSDLWAHGSDFVAKRKEINDGVFSGIAFKDERTYKNESEKKAAAFWKRLHVEIIIFNVPFEHILRCCYSKQQLRCGDVK